MPHSKVCIKTVYDKKSHYRKGNYAPVISKGEIDTKKRAIKVTTHLTPELRKHHKERTILMSHEKREAKLLAQGKTVHYAHRVAASKDPEWLKGDKGYRNIWARLGHKKPKFK